MSSPYVYLYCIFRWGDKTILWAIIGRYLVLLGLDVCKYVHTVCQIWYFPYLLIKQIPINSHRKAHNLAQSIFLEPSSRHLTAPNRQSQSAQNTNKSPSFIPSALPFPFRHILNVCEHRCLNKRALHLQEFYIIYILLITTVSFSNADAHIKTVNELKQITRANTHNCDSCIQLLFDGFWHSDKICIVIYPIYICIYEYWVGIHILDGRDWGWGGWVFRSDLMQMRRVAEVQMLTEKQNVIVLWLLARVEKPNHLSQFELKWLAPSGCGWCAEPNNTSANICEAAAFLLFQFGSYRVFGLI